MINAAKSSLESDIDNIEYQHYLKNLLQDSKKLKLFLWALHNKTRFSMLVHMAEKSLSVKDLSHKIDELHSVTSFHLKHLRNNNLVTYREDGKERIYGVNNIIKPLSNVVSVCNTILSSYDPKNS